MVGERIRDGVIGHQEIQRVFQVLLDDELNLYGHLPATLGKGGDRHRIALHIPVPEHIRLRRDFEGERLDAQLVILARAQAQRVRTQSDRARIVIVRAVDDFIALHTRVCSRPPVHGSGLHHPG